MTIKELHEITESLIAQGHGELDACVEDQSKDMVTSFEARLDKGTYYKWIESGYEGYSKMFLNLTLDV